MKGLDWIKVVSNIAFDDDIEHVSDAAFRTFIELLGISAFRVSDGRIAYRDAQKLCNTRHLTRALTELSKSRHLYIEGDEIVLRCYEKYQQTRQELELSRSKIRDRVTRYRSVGNAVGNASVTEQSKSKSKSKTPKPPSDFSDEFDSFWSKYPRKDAKPTAKKAFTKAARQVGAAAIMMGLETQLPTMSAKERQFIPLPATWLNQERWADEVDSKPYTPPKPLWRPVSDDELQALESIADFGRTA